MSTELTKTNMDATALILNQQSMESMYKLAEMMAASVVTVPKHLQGNTADCLAVVLQSAQWGMNPFPVAQKTHVINGALGYEAQLINAVVSSSRAIVGRFHYQYKDWKPAKEQRRKKDGSTYQVNTEAGLVRVGAILAGERDITWGEWLDTSKVSTKNSGLWNTAPKQQAAYLAVKYWARLYCPEPIMGVYSPDELEQPPERDITPQSEQVVDRAAELEQLMSAPGNGQQPAQREQLHPDTQPIDENRDPTIAADTIIKTLEAAPDTQALDTLHDEGIQRMRDLYTQVRDNENHAQPELFKALVGNIEARYQELRVELMQGARA